MEVEMEEELLKQLDDLSDKQFLEVYRHLSQRFREKKKKSRGRLKPGRKVSVTSSDGDTVTGEISEVYPVGFRMLSSDGVSVAVSEGADFTVHTGSKGSPANKPEEKKKYTVRLPSGTYSVELGKMSGVLAQVFFEDGTERKMLKSKIEGLS